MFASSCLTYRPSILLKFRLKVFEYTIGDIFDGSITFLILLKIRNKNRVEDNIINKRMKNQKKPLILRYCKLQPMFYKRSVYLNTVSV